MPTFEEVLPATKSSAHNGIRWTPSETVRNAGLLMIDTKRHRVSYLVLELAAPVTMRAFVFAKTTDTPGADVEAEAYTVVVGEAGQHVQCDCKGFLFGKGRVCKHVAAADAILANGWLDAPVNPDRDCENRELYV